MEMCYVVLWQHDPFSCLHLQPPSSVIKTNFLFRRAIHYLLSLVLNLVLCGTLLLSVSKYDHPWASEYDHDWLSIIFFCSETLALLSSLAPHLPSPLSFPLVPAAVILFNDCYLYPSSQVSQVNTASHPANQIYCYRLVAQGKRDTEKDSPFLLFYNLLLLPSYPCQAFAPTSL